MPVSRHRIPSPPAGRHAVTRSGSDAGHRTAGGVPAPRGLSVVRGLSAVRGRRDLPGVSGRRGLVALLATGLLATGLLAAGAPASGTPAAGTQAAGIPVAATTLPAAPAPAATSPGPATAPRPAPVGPTPASSSGALHWTVTPADASGPDDRVSLRHTVDPGQTVADHIAVTNLGAETATLRVLAGDGVLGRDGAFDIASGEPQDAGAWISVDAPDAGALTLSGGETRVLPLTIAVPADATPGDHPAGIVVASSTAADAVTVTHRIGVRVHLRVAGEAESRLEVRQVSTSFSPSWIPFAPGTLRVRLEVSNVGDVRLGAAASAGGSGALGWAAERGGGRIEELLPGDSSQVTVEVDAWPLALLAGRASVAGVAVGEDDVVPPPVVESGFRQLAVSWTGLALLAALAAGVAGLRHRRRAATGARRERDQGSDGL